MKTLEEIEEKINERLENLEAHISKLEDMANKQFKKIAAAESLQKRVLNQAFELLENHAKEFTLNTDVSVRNSSEAVWASVFHDAIENCGWLKNRKLFPGRWAVGYPALYAMFRVLENFRPKKILELGLGQSTRIIGQYAAANLEVSHTVVEADPNWINFFKNDFELPQNTRVQNLEYVMLPYQDKEVRQYKDFAKNFKEQKFDFIFIDAPLGGDMIDFSRVDVLQLLPSCLENSFVIMIDDYNRPQEQNTVTEMEKVLLENEIAYKRGVYSGQKKAALICSKDLSFLTSM